MDEINGRLRAVVDRHGPWTAMSIKLADGVYTRQQAPDHRLKRIIQVCSDLSRKPLAECRVLDLACLEGHYGIEFARHGAEVVGIEGREASVAKCEFAKAELGLTRAKFFLDDVRNLSVQTYGTFDIVLCSGLLYHLPAQDAWNLLRAMRSVCHGIVVIDTFIAFTSQVTVEIDGKTYHGHLYGEHGAADSPQERKKKLWASLDNDVSFWFTEASLQNLLARAGYTSFLDVMLPAMPGNQRDRKTYVAMVGQEARVLTSDETDKQVHAEIPEGLNPRFDASQKPKGRLLTTAKRVLPQGLKNALKPTLRFLKILPPDTTPDFMREHPKA